MGVLRLGVDLTVSETLPWMSGSEQCRRSGIPFSGDSGMGLYSIRKDLGFLVPLTFTLWINCLGKISGSPQEAISSHIGLRFVVGR